MSEICTQEITPQSNLISEGGVRSGGIEKAGHDSSFLFNMRDFNIRDPWGMKHRGWVASFIEREPGIERKTGEARNAWIRGSQHAIGV